MGNIAVKQEEDVVQHEDAVQHKVAYDYDYNTYLEAIAAPAAAPYESIKFNHYGRGDHEPFKRHPYQLPQSVSFNENPIEHEPSQSLDSVSFNDILLYLNDSCPCHNSAKHELIASTLDLGQVQLHLAEVDPLGSSASHSPIASPDDQFFDAADNQTDLDTVVSDESAYMSPQFGGNPTLVPPPTPERPIPLKIPSRDIFPLEPALSIIDPRAAFTHLPVDDPFTSFPMATISSPSISNSNPTQNSTRYRTPRPVPFIRLINQSPPTTTTIRPQNRPSRPFMQFPTETERSPTKRRKVSQNGGQGQEDEEEDDAMLLMRMFHDGHCKPAPWTRALGRQGNSVLGLEEGLEQLELDSFHLGKRVRSPSPGSLEGGCWGVAEFGLVGREG
ncbi:hypothetical protein K469DRAFT_803609 [Zopfia rhizophila CBS 207.26]|uniref:Uncharacterized protein n=1 Tax=Zopfia rhizophila CBS 207.26 TaxID=1314779 RepID=A0A6A6DJ74_9PEZI|nr:hypothetical protein K469DRAFT_803609 [Zopfia rhizophila CBS 207.26]